jgi:hypothetical protein
MKFHARMLSARLITVMAFAYDYREEEKSRSGLAETIADAQREEFSYKYRAADQTIKQGFITANKIERYISFLQELKLLDDNFQPQISKKVLRDTEEVYQVFADTAKDVLSEKGIGVQKIAEISNNILRDNDGVLPTVDEIFDLADTNLAEWRFRWLISLYTLGMVSLLRFRQSPLLLPRKYTRDN